MQRRAVVLARCHSAQQPPPVPPGARRELRLSVSALWRFSASFIRAGISIASMREARCGIAKASSRDQSTAERRRSAAPGCAPRPDSQRPSQQPEVAWRAPSLPNKSCCLEVASQALGFQQLFSSAPHAETRQLPTPRRGGAAILRRAHRVRHRGGRRAHRVRHRGGGRRGGRVRDWRASGADGGGSIAAHAGGGCSIAPSRPPRAHSATAAATSCSTIASARPRPTCSASTPTRRRRG